MNEKKRQVLMHAYQSFDVSTDSDDYEVIGKVVAIRRMLAELLDLDLSQNMMPGEYIDDEEDELERKYFEKSSEVSEELTKMEIIRINRILKISSNMRGLYDSDDACLRCARRMLAEVIDYEPLSHYRLMGERDEVKPIYYK